MLKRVIFVNEKQAQRMSGRPSAAIISITSPGKTPPTLGVRWRSVLRLEFDDVDPITFPGANEELQQMTPRQAEEVHCFVSALPASVHSLVIHCKSGISRSAGVAKAVADGYRLRFPDDYKDYNRYVHDLVLSCIQTPGDLA